MRPIETGRPIPKRNGGGRKKVYPELFEMNVGDSFEVLGFEVDTVKFAARYCTKKEGKRFVVREEPKSGKFYVWRTE